MYYYTSKQANLEISYKILPLKAYKDLTMTYRYFQKRFILKSFQCLNLEKKKKKEAPK